jgi:hypothetical protein
MHWWTTLAGSWSAPTRGHRAPTGEPLASATVSSRRPTGGGRRDCAFSIKHCTLRTVHSEPHSCGSQPVASRQFPHSSSRREKGNLKARKLDRICSPRATTNRTIWGVPMFRRSSFAIRHMPIASPNWTGGRNSLTDDDTTRKSRASAIVDSQADTNDVRNNKIKLKNSNKKQSSRKAPKKEVWLLHRGRHPSFCRGARATRSPRQNSLSTECRVHQFDTRRVPGPWTATDVYGRRRTTSDNHRRHTGSQA